jgi:hypothetical protein
MSLPPSKAARRSRVTVSDLMSAGLVRAGQALLGPSQRDANAKIAPDGRISVDGTIYPSLSTAASSIAKLETNGWTYWRIEYEGQWVKIQELRRRLEASKTT